MPTPTENEYVAISFADLRFHLANENQNINKRNPHEQKFTKEDA